MILRFALKAPRRVPKVSVDIPTTEKKNISAGEFPKACAVECFPRGLLFFSSSCDQHPSQDVDEACRNPSDVASCSRMFRCCLCGQSETNETPLRGMNVTPSERPRHNATLNKRPPESFRGRSEQLGHAQTARRVSLCWNTVTHAQVRQQPSIASRHRAWCRSLASAQVDKRAKHMLSRYCSSPARQIARHFRVCILPHGLPRCSEACRSTLAHRTPRLCFNLPASAAAARSGRAE